MPNDAKLGLVVGVGLVVAVAVCFFNKDPGGSPPPGDMSVAALGPSGQPAGGSLADGLPVKRSGGIRHTVQAGDTLVSLAKRYYGDDSKTADLLRVNRGAIPSPDQLVPGTVLIIPPPSK